MSRFPCFDHDPATRYSPQLKPSLDSRSPSLHLNSRTFSCLSLTFASTFGCRRFFDPCRSFSPSLFIGNTFFFFTTDFCTITPVRTVLRTDDDRHSLSFFSQQTFLTTNARIFLDSYEGRISTANFDQDYLPIYFERYRLRNTVPSAKFYNCFTSVNRQTPRRSSLGLFRKPETHPLSILSVFRRTAVAASPQLPSRYELVDRRISIPWSQVVTVRCSFPSRRRSSVVQKSAV